MGACDIFQYGCLSLSIKIWSSDEGLVGFLFHSVKWLAPNSTVFFLWPTMMGGKKAQTQGLTQLSLIGLSLNSAIPDCLLEYMEPLLFEMKTLFSFFFSPGGIPKSKEL